MTILQTPVRVHPCPECGVGLLEDRLITYKIPYDHEDLPVQHIAKVCQNPKCNMIMTDSRAEFAQERAIRAYVLRKPARMILLDDLASIRPE
jgi:hypothetical protein